MDIFKKKALEIEIKNYQHVAAQYEVINKQLLDRIIKLYTERKTTITVLNLFHEYVSSLKNNQLFVKTMEGAENLQAFQELISKEERGEICPTFASNGGIGSTMAGVT